MDTTSTRTCPRCDRHCPEDQVRCLRGMAHFQKTVTEEWLQMHSRGQGGPKPLDPNAPTADQIAALLQACGHALHHGGPKNASKLLAGLSESEQLELLHLLKKRQQGSTSESTAQTGR